MGEKQEIRGKVYLQRGMWGGKNGKKEKPDLRSSWGRSLEKTKPLGGAKEKKFKKP